MHRVLYVEPTEGFRLYVAFADGIKGEIDVSGRLFGPMFEPLKDWEIFSKASVDEFGVVCWPNGADLAPDAMYENLVGQHADT